MNNYDPNIIYCDAVIKITLQAWEHKGTFEIISGGNMKGMDLISAVCDEDSIYDALDSDQIINNRCELSLVGDDESGADWFSCVLIDEKGDEMKCEQEFSDLAEMIVAAEIISYERRKEEPSKTKEYED